MSIKRDDIQFDPKTGKLVTYISIGLLDGNGMILKAKAEMYMSIMNKIDGLINGVIGEFAEKYGDEVIKYAHDNLDEAPGGPIAKVKWVNSSVCVDSRETQQKLLDRAFPEEQPDA